MAAPSPRPQLEGELDVRVTALVAGSVSGVFVAIGAMIARVGAGGERVGRSAVVRGDGMPGFAEPHVDVVVVAAEPGREALADEDRIVEVDDLDVTRRIRPESLDHRPRRGPVVGAGAPRRAA